MAAQPREHNRLEVPRTGRTTVGAVATNKVFNNLSVSPFPGEDFSGDTCAFTVPGGTDGSSTLDGIV